MIKKLLEPFSFNFRQLQNFSFLVKSMKKHDVSIDEFLEYVEKGKAFFQGTFASVMLPRCEVCDSELSLKTNALSEKGKIYKTSWVCPKCGREEYSDKSVQEWFEELKIETGKQNDKTEEQHIG